MNRLETLVSQFPITIETRRVWQPEGEQAIPVPFTLHFQGRSLRETIHTTRTITPFQALDTLFVFVDAARTDSHFRALSRKTKKKVRALLGSAYQRFWQAFVQDRQEERDEMQAIRQERLAVVPKGDELVFQPGERVRYLGDGGGLREEDWVDAVVIKDMWRDGQFQGVLIRREKDGQEWTMPPQRLLKKHQWT